MFTAVLFDLIGTTVKEADPDVFTNSFEKAFAEHNVTISISDYRKHRGKDKKEIIEKVLTSQQLSLSLVEDIYASFKKNIMNDLNKFQANDGANDIFAFLKERNIKTGIGTGLEREILESIIKHLDWDHSMFDYIGIAHETGRNRPYPDMIFDMMTKLSLSDTGQFLKVGDTVADIEEGKNAKVMTAVILSGTQSKEDLLNAGPDYVLHSLPDIKKIL